MHDISRFLYITNSYLDIEMNTFLSFIGLYNSSNISRNVNPPLPSPLPAPAPAPTPAPIIITPPVTTRVTNHAIGKNLLFDGLITTSG